jgi:transposase
MNLKEIEELMKREKNIRNYERLLAIRMFILGTKPDDIAEEIHRSRATIYNWISLFSKNGWESLKFRYSTGKKPKLTPDDFAQLRDVLETKKPKDIDFLKTDQEYWDIEISLEFINGYFGTDYTYYGVWRILREKLKFQYTKPYPKNYKRPENADEILKKRIGDAVDDVLSLKDNKNFRVVLWDEASFQNKPNTTRILAPPNTKSTIDVSYNPKQGIKAFGWIDISGNVGTISSDSSKRKDFKEALLMFRKLYKKEEPILILMDNAKIHKGEEMNVFYKDNSILPVFFPVYSSDLNPEEQIWRMVRKPLKNKIFKEKSDIREALESAVSKIDNLTNLLGSWIKKFIPIDAYPHIKSPYILSS